jgi:hypothetical protein
VADEILNLITRVNRAILSDKSKRIALSTTLAKHKPRIFERGQASDGSQIGTYSKKYGEFKSKKGRNPGYVNLVLTGQMQSDYGLLISGEQYAFGFQNDFNGNKSEWMTDKYDKEIFHLSEEEIDLFMDVLNDEISKA